MKPSPQPPDSTQPFDPRPFAIDETARVRLLARAQALAEHLATSREQVSLAIEEVFTPLPGREAAR